MKREDIDASLRSMRWGAETRGDAGVAAQIEAARALLPEGPIDEAWGRFVQALVHAVFPEVWPKGEELWKFKLAFELDAMCREADCDPTRLPPAVREVLDREYVDDIGNPRRTHRGRLGNRPYVAGAFAIARGYHSGPLNAAKQWIIDTEVMELGERAGARFPGIKKRKTRV